MSNAKEHRRSSYLARFGYIGSHFHGLQPNSKFKTAGGSLREILEEAAGQKAKALQFSARTDAGVHALENFATFWFPSPFDHDLFIGRLNQSNLGGLLYIEARKVSYKVHARASAKGKWYRYVLCDEMIDPDSKDPFFWQVAPKLDIKAMQRAAQLLIGTHDFSAFRHGGCTAGTSTRTVTDVTVTRCPNNQIHIDVRGEGFLRRMVRIMVGTLAEVGAGLRQPSEIAQILESKRRRKAGPSAPASGLTLMRVGSPYFETPY